MIWEISQDDHGWPDADDAGQHCTFSITRVTGEVAHSGAADGEEAHGNIDTGYQSHAFLGHVGGQRAHARIGQGGKQAIGANDEQQRSRDVVDPLDAVETEDGGDEHQRAQHDRADLRRNV